MAALALFHDEYGHELLFLYFPFALKVSEALTWEFVKDQWVLLRDGQPVYALLQLAAKIEIKIRGSLGRGMY